MTIVKLKNAGESVTWLIKSAQEVPGNFGPQVKFEDADSDDVVYLPLDSAVRQLERIGLSVSDCAGNRLVISRDPNPKSGAAPYWGISVASAPSVPSKRLPPPERVQPFDEPTDEERFAQFAEEVEELNAPVAQRHAEAPSVKASSVAGLLTKYAELFRAADLKLKEAYGAKCPPDVVQSAVATIWIESNKRGLV